MKRFKNILVGIDLSWADRFVADELSATSAEAVRQSLWLAKLNSASVHFLFSLELSLKAQQLISMDSTDESSMLDEAEKRLADLVSRARKEGIAAESSVVLGKSWVELIRQVLRGKHDLVLVGTRHHDAMEGFLLSYTGIKLVRKCPCPVWITHPREDQPFDSILVAHDLLPVGDLAMELGYSMAQLHQAQLHVVHAAEHSELDYMFPKLMLAKKLEEYRSEAKEHIQSQLANANLSQPAQIHLVSKPADVAIMKCVDQYNIDLIVMGTVGRTGISGIITGNTAERLLPRIPCSVLAVKPRNFACPIRLDE
jgi:universal stress protein E